MQKFNTQNKGNALLILLVIIVLVVVAFWWLMKSGYKIPGQVSTPTPTPTSVIQDKSDFDSADEQLDSADLNQIDAGVNLILKDSSSF